MIKIIKHSNIDQYTLKEIVKIKQLSWDYPYESHLNWIRENIQDDDLHFILYENDKMIAYINLVNADVIIDDSLYKSIGIGNVCAASKGKGYGGRIMIELNRYLIQIDSIGILLCKSPLLEFYKKFSWEIVDVVDVEKETHLLCFNVKKTYKEFKYTGRAF